VAPPGLTNHIKISIASHNMRLHVNAQFDSSVGPIAVLSTCRHHCLRAHRRSILIRLEVAKQASLFPCIVQRRVAVFNEETHAWEHAEENYTSVYVVVVRELLLYHGGGVRCGTTECGSTPRAVKKLCNEIYASIQGDPLPFVSLSHAKPYGWAVAGYTVCQIVEFVKQLLPRVELKRSPVRKSHTWSLQYSPVLHTLCCLRKTTEARGPAAIQFLSKYLGDRDACALVLEMAGIGTVVEVSREAEKPPVTRTSRKRRRLY